MNTPAEPAPIGAWFARRGWSPLHIQLSESELQRLPAFACLRDGLGANISLRSLCRRRFTLESLLLEPLQATPRLAAGTPGEARASALPARRGATDIQAGSGRHLSAHSANQRMADLAPFRRGISAAQIRARKSSRRSFRRRGRLLAGRVHSRAS